MPELQATLEGFRDRMMELSQRFARQSARYRGPAYNEETARSEFISPFFEALGWDIANRQGHALQYRDVIHEEGIKVGDATKAPDYTFRIGGQRKFFVEAKKPGVDLKHDVAPAYQLRRYAWSAHLPLSILTDFEELAVYDTRIKPGATDKASVARVFYFGHEEYPDKAEEIWNIFSKRAVLEGSFDAYAEDNRKKRGTTEVDAEILKEIEGWREELAKNLALRNEGLTVDELNYAVQATIDRILFLRIAEGRGAEDYGRLLALTAGPAIYGRLIELFSKADERYNSGVFDFKADRLTLKLALDDKVLKPILKGLYYPESPYEFSVLPAEILGNVYEQFLGKVIRLTAGGRAKVEEKPEVKKAGGVYYTPRYIVEYIVAHTVGKLAEGKPPKEMAKLRIVDPACGSGSFLLSAYQKLLDVHLSWYREHEPKRHKNEVFEGQGGDWRLTTAKKREILLNSIYGVDIDRQAVEVSKLSLLLKCLEGETNETLRQMNLYGERALPSLEKNIQCGNSLISPQALSQHQGGLFPDPEELRRINPFDWQKAFPEVFKAGGFDAVIGNPPYIRIQTMKEWAPLEVELYKLVYRSAAAGNYDIYVVFLERGFALLNHSGCLGFIVPTKFFSTDYGEALRALLSEKSAIEQVVDFGHEQVFDRATTYTCLLFLRSSQLMSAA
ncbi:MAG: N-6 DNA methylase [Thermoanaerobaculia bacterium]